MFRYPVLEASSIQLQAHGFGSRRSLSVTDLFCKGHEIGRSVLQDHEMRAWVFFSEQETRGGESHAFSHEISPLNLYNEVLISCY